jgi:hypothetical protein
MQVVQAFGRVEVFLHTFLTWAKDISVSFKPRQLLLPTEEAITRQ